MEVAIQYWDFDSEKYVDANSFASVCTWNEKLGKYDRKTLFVKVVAGGVRILNFKAQPTYDQCCGLREIGLMEVYTSNIDAVRTTLVEALERHHLFCSVGALTYTRYKNPDYESQGFRLIKFIEEWPDASAGAWFYNPNSGNMVQQWTLPINQHKQHGVSSEDDDE